MLVPPPPQEAINRQTRSIRPASIIRAGRAVRRCWAASKARIAPSTAHIQGPCRGSGQTPGGGASEDREVVESWSDTWVLAEPSMLTEAREKEQEVVSGAPAHPSAILRLNPLMGVSVSVKVAVWPASMEIGDAEAASPKSAKRTVRVSVAVEVSPEVVERRAGAAVKEFTVPVTV